MNHININRPELDSYVIAAVNEPYTAMNKAYNAQEYSEAVNYAKAMAESTCNYVYKLLKGKTLQEEKGSYQNLHKVTSESLKALRSELTHPDLMSNISNEMVSIIDKLGQVRNATSVAHGSGRRVEPIAPVEARYLMFMSESFCTFVLDLLFNKTHSLKTNAVGSVLDPDGMKIYHAADGNIEAAVAEDGTRYEVNNANNVIFMVTVEFELPLNTELDAEYLSDYIRGYVEDDAVIDKPTATGLNAWRYYSPSKDFYYDVSFVKNTLYISTDWHQMD
ncbi:abortive infection family protein [Loigolactobacillus coryniformis]|uniref:abortive infection family protein n=1 Tax=Loigolactobacillus coryniformis TaxID=1610 RepID=UPI003F1F111F